MSNSLKSVREILLYPYAEDIVDETEIMLLYDANKSRKIYPYWNFEKFDLENFDDGQCLTDFHIRKNDIFRLKECLELSENSGETKSSSYNKSIYLFTAMFRVELHPFSSNQFFCKSTKKYKFINVKTPWRKIIKYN